MITSKMPAFVQVNSEAPDDAFYLCGPFWVHPRGTSGAFGAPKCAAFPPNQALRDGRNRQRPVALGLIARADARRR
jgi:hypothetical protein